MNDAVMINAFSALERAQRAQIASLAQQRFSQASVAPSVSYVPVAPRDSVVLGGSVPDLGLMPSPYKLAQVMYMGQMELPLASDPNFWEKQNAYYDKVFQQLDMIRAMEAANGIVKSGSSDTSETKKGDLNVVAGNRKDGVKAKKVTVHEHRNWKTRQHDENTADYNSHESKFEGAKVGQTYQVNVEWADGTTTTRDVRMDEPGQTVYIDTAY